MSDEKKGGVKVRCRKCGDVIQSRHVHDMKWCECGAIAIDGGEHYMRLLGDKEDIEVLTDWDARCDHEGTGYGGNR